MNHVTSARSGVSRRAVLAGAAWSVPAVLVVGATPAFAYSTDRLMAPNSIAVQRLNGAKTATYTFVATNPNSHDDIVILSITPSFAPGTWLSLTTNSYASLVTAPNGTTTVVFTGTQGNADATVFAFSFEVKYTIGGGPTEYSSTWTVSAGSVTGSETWYLAGTNYSETNPVIP